MISNSLFEAIDIAPEQIIKTAETLPPKVITKQMYGIEQKIPIDAELQEESRRVKEVKHAIEKQLQVQPKWIAPVEVIDSFCKVSKTLYFIKNIGQDGKIHVNRIPTKERPKVVEKRNRIGDYERDTVYRE